jgi:hypothetical protein
MSTNIIASNIGAVGSATGSAVATAAASQLPAAGNASIIALATMGLSGNKYILGLMILLINLGARYIGNEVSEFMHKVLNHKFARRFLIFLVLWMGTRDLVVASVITISFIVLVNTLFNENSRFCILPVENDSPITNEEYLLAKTLVNKYEKINMGVPMQNNTNTNTTDKKNMVSSSLPINNNIVTN